MESAVFLRIFGIFWEVLEFVGILGCFLIFLNTFVDSYAFFVIRNFGIVKCCYVRGDLYCWKRIHNFSKIHTFHRFPVLPHLVRSVFHFLFEFLEVVEISDFFENCWMPLTFLELRKFGIFGMFVMWNDEMLPCALKCVLFKEN